MEIIRKKIVYIAHPVGESVKENLLELSRIYKILSIEDSVVPFIPYYATVTSLDDKDPKLRSIGFNHNLEIFKTGIIDEVWLYGVKISVGMQKEINWAKELCIPVISKSNGTKCSLTHSLQRDKIKKNGNKQRKQS